MNGARREFPEALQFDFDDEGLIERVDIYIKQPSFDEQPPSDEQLPSDE